MEEEIARGGMGVVHKATDLATNDLVVIKSLLAEVAQIEDYKKRFIREAEEWVQLGAHPNIVRAHTAHEIEYLPRLVLEYIDGCSMDDLLAEQELPPMARALDIAVQICWGMAFAHDKGLIHRDLKPANIMVTKDGTVKITDFGLVKRLLEKAEKQLATSNKIPPMQTLMTQGIMGTPEYMAPEQWQEEAIQSSDIYAFGIILYELFCAQRPYDYPLLKGLERVTAYLTAHCKEPLPRPKSIVEEIPEPIETLIQQCLEKDPQKRPSSFRNITASINKIAKQIIGNSFRKEPAAEQLGRHARLDQANAYMRLAGGCLFRGDHNKATDLFEKAHSIFITENDQRGKASYHLNLGTIYFKRADYESALKHMNKSLAIYKVLNNHIGMCSCYGNIGLLHQIQENSDVAMEMYEKNLEIAKLLENQAEIARCYTNIGVLLSSLEEYDRAFEMFQKSKDIGETIGNQALTTRCYLNLGNILLRREEFEKASDMYHKSLNIAVALDDKTTLGTIYNNLGSLFLKSGKYQKAQAMFQKCQHITEKLGDRLRIAQCYGNIGYLLGKQGEYHKATEMIQKSIDIYGVLNNQSGTGLGCLNMGEVLMETEDHDQALKFIKKGLETGYAISSKRLTSEGLYSMGQIYMKQNRNTEALDFFQQSLTIMKTTGNPKQAELEELIAELKEQSEESKSSKSNGSLPD
ncbi:tetratricopeptide repeat protein [Planctomycetota bacterium]